MTKDDSLKKEKRKNKGLTKIIRNEGEQQKPPKPDLTDDEKKVLEEARAIQRKQRDNNGARRDIHIEAKVEYHDVYPDDPDFDIGKARPLEPTRPTSRSSCLRRTPRARVSARATSGSSWQ